MEHRSGPHSSDRASIDLARVLDRDLPWFQTTPEFRCCSNLHFKHCICVTVVVAVVDRIHSDDVPQMTSVVQLSSSSSSAQLYRQYRYCRRSPSCPLQCDRPSVRSCYNPRVTSPASPSSCFHVSSVTGADPPLGRWANGRQRIWHFRCFTDYCNSAGPQAATFSNAQKAVKILDLFCSYHHSPYYRQCHAGAQYNTGCL